MKKYICIALFGLLLVPFTSFAADIPSNAYFFGDGKGYDESGNQKYYCFGTGVSLDCYSLEGVFVFVRQVQSTIEYLQNKVNELQNTVTELQNQQQQPVVSSPQALQTPVVTDTVAPKLLKIDSYDTYRDQKNAGITFLTDEPTKVTIRLYKAYTSTEIDNKMVLTWEEYLKSYIGDGEMRIKKYLAEHGEYAGVIVLTDNNYSTEHKFLFSSYPFSKGDSLYGIVKFTDNSGNTTEVFSVGF